MTAESSYTIVLVSSASNHRDRFVEMLKRRGFLCRLFDNVTTAERFLKGQVPRLVLIDAESEKYSLVDAVTGMTRQFPLIDVVPFSFSRKMEGNVIVGAFRAQAREFLLGPIGEQHLERIEEIIDQQRFVPRIQQLREELANNCRFEGLLSRSQKMWDVFEMVERIAETDATVLIEGETGTGKELVARAVHQRSRRKAKSFLAINCGAFTDTLLDSELFGHERGSFTGAVRKKTGLFEKADNATLFLDEIGNISTTMQQRLLRVIETGLFRRVGGTEELRSDIRFIAATNRNLDEAVVNGDFREDLFYRLNVLRVMLPPLRERPEDILFLFQHNIERFSKQYRLRRPTVSDRVIDILLSYSWPGNVRELKNVAERSILVARDGRILSRHLPSTMRETAGSDVASRSMPFDLSKPLNDVVTSAIATVEKAYLQRILEKYEGRIQRTARNAGISRRTLYRKMRMYGLTKESYKKQNRGLGNPPRT